jgi:hypothetical protein
VTELRRAILTTLASRRDDADLLELAEAVWSRGGSIASLIAVVEQLVANGLVVERAAPSGGRFRLHPDLRSAPPSEIRRRA